MSSCSRKRTKAPRSARNRRNNGGFSTRSAEIVADLDDVLIQILTFLPIKSLLKSKRVSKRWLSLITNPDFSNRILKSKHPLPISGFFLKGTHDMEYRFVSLDDDDKERISSSLPLRFADHPTKMIILQSTNGLLLCKCSCPSNQFDISYYVYNPSTKQNTLLPRIIDHVAISLAFDPSKSPHYKVFCLKSVPDSNLFYIEVYSSNEGPWRRVVSVPSFTLPPTVMEFGNTIFWNDAVLWYGRRSRDCLSFDIYQEKIKIVPLPYLDHQEEEEEEEEEDGPPDVGRTLRFLDESRGNLYYTEVYDLSSSKFPVYEMERDGSNWSLKHNVDLEPLAAAFPEMIRTEHYTDRPIYAFSVIGIVKEETNAESYILLHIPNQVLKYNFRNKTFKKLCGFKASLDIDVPGYEFYGFQRCFQFIESLANV
ncbi:hypothetical protein AALP_AA8G071900 [Arabis alpina]|uniref:F-box domain-containing protein n=1 Tax=Arabis alpina TaxID=50452 RepID=A0A087G5J5_ARAAL|nr:hypothetical protein AALP_AA8G071900 [Arabis alpina]